MWTVSFEEEFYNEFKDFSLIVRESISIKAGLLEIFGSQLGRPHVDTLQNSKYPNMKELRFNIDNEIWRIAFTFDPRRNAILLVGGD